MRHPEQGELLPEAFLPVAESSGLIQPLGEWIIREALSAAHDWPEHLGLSINLSLAQLRYGDVAATIINTLTKSGVDGSRLRVEIPEAALLIQSKGIEDQLSRLKSQGATIVLDDFGLETTRLKSLSILPCDAVKLDRTLIAELGAEPGMESLVRGADRHRPDPSISTSWRKGWSGPSRRTSSSHTTAGTCRASCSVVRCRRARSRRSSPRTCASRSTRDGEAAAPVALRGVSRTRR